LPEDDVAGALARLAALESSQHLLSKGVKSVDLRFPGRVIVGIAEIEETTSGKSKLKLSQNE
jgi:cell division septal protein FtsQ